MKRSVILSALIALASLVAASPKIAATPVAIAKGDPSVYRKELELAEAMRSKGTLSPSNAHVIDDLKKQLAAPP